MIMANKTMKYIVLLYYPKFFNYILTSVIMVNLFRVEKVSDLTTPSSQRFLTIITTRPTSVPKIEWDLQDKTGKQRLVEDAT